MNRGPSRLLLFFLIVTLSALLACSYMLHTEVSVTNGRVEFRFTTCGTVFYGSPADIDEVMVYEYDPATKRQLGMICVGDVPRTSKWSYGASISGCKPLEPGKAYSIYAKRPGHHASLSFKLEASGPVALSPQCR